MKRTVTRLAASVLSRKFVAWLLHGFRVSDEGDIDAHRTGEGDADDFQRRRHAAHGHNTVALAAAALTLRTEIVLACQREPSTSSWRRGLVVGPIRSANGPIALSQIALRIIYDEMRTGGPPHG